MKIGIIGYGYWGPNIVRNFLSCSDVVIVKIADASPARIADIEKSYPSIPTTNSAEEIIQSADIDAVVIATPVHTHYPLAEAALRAGKHVLVEKPLASTLVHAEALVALAEEKNLCLMVDHTYLYSDAVQTIHSLIEKGELGIVQTFSSTRINLGLFQSDINVLWDLAPHDISILLYLFKELPQSVNATGAAHTKTGLENVAYLTAHYKSGMIAHISNSWVSPLKVRQILIGGDKKMVVYNDTEPTEKIKIYDSGYTVRTDEEKNRLYMDYRSGDITIPKIENKEPLRTMAEDFLHAAATNTNPRSNARFGLDVVRILDAADRSMKAGGGAVQLFT